MATAAERGFSFKDLPMVIDPASEVVEVKLAPYRPGDGVEPTGDIRFAQYHKLVVPFEHLPYVKSLEFANLYGDDPDYDRADKAFAYGGTGILRAILYRDGTPYRNWVVERMPEEFTGEHVMRASVRFMFEEAADASRVAELAGRLQAVRMGNHYDGMQSDAQELINLVVGKGSEPRLVEVADPVQRKQF